MPTDDHSLRVFKEGLEAFAICLVLGTLQAIRSEAWSPDAGAWTIGLPRFEGLLENADFPEDVMAVIDQAGEFSAIRDLTGLDACS